MGEERLDDANQVQAKLFHGTKVQAQKPVEAGRGACRVALGEREHQFVLAAEVITDESNVDIRVPGDVAQRNIHRVLRDHDTRGGIQKALANRRAIEHCLWFPTCLRGHWHILQDMAVNIK